MKTRQISGLRDVPTVPAIVDRLLTQAGVELEHHKKSHWNSALEAFPTLSAVGLLCSLPLIFFPSLKIGCGIAWFSLSVALLHDNWKRIGTRRGPT